MSLYVSISFDFAVWFLFGFFLITVQVWFAGCTLNNFKTLTPKPFPPSYKMHGSLYTVSYHAIDLCMHDNV